MSLKLVEPDGTGRGGCVRSPPTAHLFLGLSLVAVGWAAAWPTAAARTTTLPIHVHLASLGGDAGPPTPAADARFIDRQLGAAQRFFGRYGVSFELVGRSRLPVGHARLQNRRDRDVLAEFCKSGVINWFVVQSLRDVDEPDRMRRGVHWHSRSHRPAHYVIVSVIAQDLVLAHELGHFLGNRRHSPTPNNLMSYTHTGDPPFLNPVQVGRMRRAIRGYLRRGELRPPGASSSHGPHGPHD